MVCDFVIWKYADLSSYKKIDYYYISFNISIKICFYGERIKPKNSLV